MKLETYDDSAKRKIYKLEIDNFELYKVSFYSHDRLLFDECEKSDKISDKLLALEKVVRRIEESNGKNT